MLAFGDYKILATKPQSVKLEEAPRYHLVNQGGSVFYVPLPYLYYRVVSNPYDGMWKIMTLYASPTPITTDNHAVSYLPLPNMYDQRPCYAVKTKIRATTEQKIVDALNSWWQARGNGDGKLAGQKVWRELAKRAEVPRTDRKKVLKYWETLSMKEMLALPWPQSKTFSPN